MLSSLNPLLFFVYLLGAWWPFLFNFQFSNSFSKMNEENSFPINCTLTELPAIFTILKQNVVYFKISCRIYITYDTWWIRCYLKLVSFHKFWEIWGLQRMLNVSCRLYFTLFYILLNTFLAIYTFCFTLFVPEKAAFLSKFCPADYTLHVFRILDNFAVTSPFL